MLQLRSRTFAVLAALTLSTPAIAAQTDKTPQTTTQTDDKNITLGTAQYMVQHESTVQKDMTLATKTIFLPTSENKDQTKYVAIRLIAPNGRILFDRILPLIIGKDEKMSANALHLGFVYTPEGKPALVTYTDPQTQKAEQFIISAHGDRTEIPADKLDEAVNKLTAITTKAPVPEKNTYKAPPELNPLSQPHT